MQIRRDCMTLYGWAARLAKLSPPALAAAAQLWMLAASAMSGWAQVRVAEQFRLQPSDIAVLESGEPRADFPCQVTPEKPSLAFDLRFHADYSVTVPLKDLREAGDRLLVLARVTPSDRNEPAYFVQRLAVPDIPPEAKGEAALTGGFDLGYGRYRVDLMIRDVGERVCSSHWELEIKPARRERNLPLTLGPDTTADRVGSSADDRLPVRRAAQHLAAQHLHVKILLNLSPATPQQSILKPEDAAVLLSILRGITREPGVNRFSLVAFNVWEQKIVARQDNGAPIDLAALAQTLQSRTVGTVNYRLLANPHRETSFVTKLLADELGVRTASPDATIIVGPKVTLKSKVSLDALKEGGPSPSPIFYLNYNSMPFDQPWPDTIGSALKAYAGALTYNIVSPRDLGAAMRKILSRIGAR